MLLRDDEAALAVELDRPRQALEEAGDVGFRFAFLDLPASGTYFLTAMKSGYLDGGYGQIDPRGPGAPLSVREGQWLRDLRVTISPPGSISGTVLDERGEPIVGAHVRVLPQVLISGRTQWLAGAVARTDDRGAYRIAGLGPGRYVVRPGRGVVRNEKLSKRSIRAPARTNERTLQGQQ